MAPSHLPARKPRIVADMVYEGNFTAGLALGGAACAAVIAWALLALGAPSWLIVVGVVLNALFALPMGSVALWEGSIYSQVQEGQQTPEWVPDQSFSLGVVLGGILSGFVIMFFGAPITLVVLTVVAQDIRRFNQPASTFRRRAQALLSH